MVVLTASATADFCFNGSTSDSLEKSSVKLARYFASPSEVTWKGPHTSICTSSSVLELLLSDLGKGNLCCFPKVHASQRGF